MKLKFEKLLSEVSLVINFLVPLIILHGLLNFYMAFKVITSKFNFLKANYDESLIRPWIGKEEKATVARITACEEY